MKYRLINKVSYLWILMLIPSFCSAASKAKSNPIMTWMMNNMLLVLSGIIVLGVLLTIWNLVNTMFVVKRREFLKASGIEVNTEYSVSDETFLSRWTKHLAGLVPVEKEADIQLDHDYDGIKELDNSLPPWWLYGFYISIIVAIGYMYVYHYSDIGLSQNEEYEVAMKKGEERKARFAAMQANNIDESNLIALLDEKSLSVGMNAFKANCAACHGQLGEGGVGPNLTDEYWIHGGSTVHIYKTIKNGVPEKGMIAWKSQMKPTTIHKLASYIQTLKGTNPPNAKAKQGQLYKKDNELDQNLTMNAK